MNIIFLSDAGNVTFKRIILRKDYFCFLWQKGNIIFVTFIHIRRKYHISMYFLGKTIVHFPSKEKVSYFRKKSPHFSRQYNKYKVSVRFFWKDNLFGAFEKVSYFHVVFWERSSFIFRLKNKIIFSGKRNIIFPDNTRKIIFQCHFFWEDHLFRIFGNRKYGFSWSVISFLSLRFPRCLFASSVFMTNNEFSV